MPNNTYINSATPIVEGKTDMFSRVWFRFFDMVAARVGMLDGTQTTSATSGGAGALPAQPAGYMTIVGQDGVKYKVPYYNA